MEERGRTRIGTDEHGRRNRKTKNSEERNKTPGTETGRYKYQLKNVGFSLAVGASSLRPLACRGSL
jgi:hypothetical protein